MPTPKSKPSRKKNPTYKNCDQDKPEDVEIHIFLPSYSYSDCLSTDDLRVRFHGRRTGLGEFGQQENIRAHQGSIDQGETDQTE